MNWLRLTLLAVLLLGALGLYVVTNIDTILVDTEDNGWLDYADCPICFDLYYKYRPYFVAQHCADCQEPAYYIRTNDDVEAKSDLRYIPDPAPDLSPEPPHGPYQHQEQYQQQGGNGPEPSPKSPIQNQHGPTNGKAAIAGAMAAFVFVGAARPRSRTIRTAKQRAINVIGEILDDVVLSVSFKFGNGRALLDALAVFDDVYIKHMPWAPMCAYCEAERVAYAGDMCPNCNAHFDEMAWTADDLLFVYGQEGETDEGHFDEL